MDMLEDYPFDEFTPSITKSIGPYAPLEDELKNNIRSRSGKLRIAFRSDAPSQGHLLSDANLWRKDKSREMRQMMRMVWTVNNICCLITIHTSLCATMSASIQVLLEAEKEALKVVQKAKACTKLNIHLFTARSCSEIKGCAYRSDHRGIIHQRVDMNSRSHPWKPRNNKSTKLTRRVCQKTMARLTFRTKSLKCKVIQYDSNSWLRGQYEKNKQQVLDKLLTQVVRVVPTIHPNVRVDWTFQ